MNANLFSQTNIQQGLFMIKLLNFHESLEKILLDTWEHIYKNIDPIMWRMENVPDDVVVLIPYSIDNGETWLCISKNHNGSYSTRKVLKGSLRNVVVSEKTAVIFLNREYDSCSE